MDAPVEVYQSEKELERLLAIVAAIRPRRVLEVGSLYGGTLWHWLQLVGPGGTVVSVDLVVPTVDHRAADILAARAQWPAWAAAAGVELVMLEADSTDPATVDEVSQYGPFDFAFIDGGHDRATVAADFTNYRQHVRPGGIMAFHDIAYPEWNRDAIDVGAWWRDSVVGNYVTGEIIEKPESWGIGVVYLEEGPKDHV